MGHWLIIIARHNFLEFVDSWNRESSTNSRLYLHIKYIQSEKRRYMLSIGFVEWEGENIFKCVFKILLVLWVSELCWLKYSGNLLYRKNN